MCYKCDAYSIFCFKWWTPYFLQHGHHGQRQLRLCFVLVKFLDDVGHCWEAFMLCIHVTAVPTLHWSMEDCGSFVIVYTKWVTQSIAPVVLHSFYFCGFDYPFTLNLNFFHEKNVISFFICHLLYSYIVSLLKIRPQLFKLINISVFVLYFYADSCA